MSTHQISKEHVENWIAEKIVKLECGACRKTEFSVGDIVAAPSTRDGGGTVIGGPAFPTVQVICNHCAHVMLCSTVDMGIHMTSKCESKESVARPRT